MANHLCNHASRYIFSRIETICGDHFEGQGMWIEPRDCTTADGERSPTTYIKYLEMRFLPFEIPYSMPWYRFVLDLNL
jgi:hypothetical protein